MSCSSGIDSSTGDCKCDQGYKISEINPITGEVLTTKVCVKCPTDEFLYLGTNTPIYECTICPPGKILNKNTIPWICECDSNLYTQFGNECFSKNEANILNTVYPSSGATSVLMTDAETTNPLVLISETISESSTIKEFYFKSGFNCLKSKDRKMCQILANICVLEMYSLKSEVCKLYKFINDLQPAMSNKE